MTLIRPIAGTALLATVLAGGAAAAAEPATASEVDAAPNAGGFMTPAAMPLWTVRMMFPRMFIRMCEVIQILGAGGLVAVPSYAEFGGPLARDVETYFQAANADARYRVKLFRLAFDAAVSSFSGRQQLYERYYSGDPVRLAATLYDLYDKNACIARITELLDDLESRQNESGAPIGFRPHLAAAE